MALGWDVSNAGVSNLFELVGGSVCHAKTQWNSELTFLSFLLAGAGVDRRKATNACALRQVSFWGSKYSYLSSRRGLIESFRTGPSPEDPIGPIEAIRSGTNLALKALPACSALP
jgi:hypothetical protein